jgi:hypothetical protein
MMDSSFATLGDVSDLSSLFADVLSTLRANGTGFGGSTTNFGHVIEAGAWRIAA